MSESEKQAINRGLQTAANEVLSVSQSELTRIQTLGFDVPTEGDRLFRQTPNYRAQPWPTQTGPEILQTYDPNSMGTGRETIQASNFAAPFQNDLGESLGGFSGNAKPIFQSPGLAFSADGNLDNMYQSSFAAGDPGQANGGIGDFPTSDMFAEPKSEAYTGLVKSMMSSISHSLDELGTASPQIRGHPTSSNSFLVDTEQTGTKLAGNMSIDKSAVVYGDSQIQSGPLDVGLPARHASEIRVRPGIVERLRLVASGIIYDLAHFSEITSDDLASVGCATKLEYIVSRDMRAPYVGILISFVLLVFLVVYAIL